MRIRLGSMLFLLALLALLASAPAAAQGKQADRIADATDVIDQLLRIPEQSIPPQLLSRAYAIAVIPSMVKVGFGVGGRFGRGILVVRKDDNSWSNPAFINMTAGSFGWQIGAQAADVVLVFKNRQGVDNISNGKLTLGGAASVAAGPVGRAGSIATDFRFKAEVLSYSRTRGLFAGVALEGAGLTMDKKSNAAFYGPSARQPEAVFASSPNAAPDVANTFVQVLTAQTSRLPTQPGMRSGVRTASASPKTSTPSVRTYAIPGPQEPDDELEDISEEW
ncbi:MAG: lipid-binding SYLF domain-containing protein [Gammaproteobacteria bacterium]|nr:lipid-binding SYLF domain-containing protein [Gammaproteobacteria bacterium]